MTDMLFICRDALASSLLSNVVLAMEAKKAGTSASVIFTGEALAALSGGVFLWPRELQEQETRLKMADNAAAMGLPTMLRGVGRQINTGAIVQKAREAGVPLFACPVWAGLLGLRGRLPEGVKEIDVSTALSILGEARTVVGSF